MLFCQKKKKGELGLFTEGNKEGKNLVRLHLERRHLLLIRHLT